MEVLDLAIEAIRPAGWNANEMDEAMWSRLRGSIQRFGLVVPLVVRPAGGGMYETVGGAERLAVLMEMGAATVPCVVVDSNDVEARLLSQCLNRIAGSDNLGLPAELLRQVLETMSQEEVLALLPETGESLNALCSLGQQTMAEYLEAWQRAQAARLRHLQFQLTQAQLQVVEDALEQVLPRARENLDGSPNVRGTALFLLCKAFLEREGQP